MRDMDWRTFAVEMTQALAWPVVVAVGLLVFRSQVSEFLARVTKVVTPVASVDAEMAGSTREGRAVDRRCSA